MTRVHLVGRFWLGVLVGLGMCGVVVSVQRLASAEIIRETRPDPVVVGKQLNEELQKKLDKKLDKLAENQELILQKLEAMSQELQIIKVRATQ